MWNDMGFNSMLIPIAITIKRHVITRWQIAGQEGTRETQRFHSPRVKNGVHFLPFLQTLETPFEKLMMWQKWNNWELTIISLSYPFSGPPGPQGKRGKKGKKGDTGEPGGAVSIRVPEPARSSPSLVNWPSPGIGPKSFSISLTSVFYYDFILMLSMVVVVSCFIGSPWSGGQERLSGILLHYPIFIADNKLYP